MRTRGKRWQKVATAALIAGVASPALLKWVRRAGHRRRAVDLRMTVVVERPIAEVFQFCRDFENFPDILDVLERVDDHQDGRSHWVVRTPAGATVEWDAVVTKYVPNSVIAWESVKDSPVKATGLMRFAPLGENETRLDLALTYRPEATPLGDAVRAMVAPSNHAKLRTGLARASTQLARDASQSPAPPA